MDDILLMVAPQHEPTVFPLSLLHKLQADRGSRSAIDDIAGDDDLIRLPTIDVGCYDL